MSRKQSTDHVDRALEEIFRQVFNVSELKSEDSMATISLWDSFGHMELMVALEKRFDIRIEPKDIINLTTVASLKKYLKEIA